MSEQKQEQQPWLDYERCGHGYPFPATRAYLAAAVQVLGWLNPEWRYTIECKTLDEAEPEFEQHPFKVRVKWVHRTNPEGHQAYGYILPVTREDVEAGGDDCEKVKVRLNQTVAMMRIWFQKWLKKSQAIAWRRCELADLRPGDAVAFQDVAEYYPGECEFGFVEAAADGVVTIRTSERLASYSVAEGQRQRSFTVAELGASK